MQYLITIGCLWLCSFSLLAQADCPCCTPAHRQFDFWIGEWNVYQNDTLAGTNHITLDQDQCLLREVWTSRGGGYTGTSYNFYNPQTLSWHQTWVDNQGGSLQLSGGWNNGSMVLESGAMTGAGGQTFVNRITWTPRADGTVRQHWEVSSNRTEWRTVFDGIYRKK